MNPDLRVFIDRVVVPALLERFLREHAERPMPVASAVDCQKPSVSV